MIKELFTYPKYEQLATCCLDLVDQLQLSQISVQESSTSKGWECSSGENFSDLLAPSKNLHTLHALERQFNTVTESLKDSAIDDFLKWFPVPLIRSRILTLVPGKKYSDHYDPSPRIHVPITTNSNAFVIIENKKYNLKNDGTVYFADKTFSYSNKLWSLS